jgi:acyl-CoA synthetase (AMP-forming)/AMP-acid ligase II
MSPGMAEIVNKSMPHKPTSLKSLLIDSAQRYGDRTAVVALHQPSHLPLGVSTGDQSGPYLRWTYSELLDGATLLAATLRQRGVQQGEPIASLLHNSADWALCFWAAALLGCPWIAIQSRTAVNADELAHILDLSRPKVILAWNQEQIEQLQASAQPQIAAVPIKIYATHSDQAPDGWSMLSSVFTEDTERLDLMADDTSNVAEDLVLVLFTSGTTGRPKGCMHTNKTITNMSRNHAHSLGLDETSSSISHLTLAHCFGLLYSVSFWSVGAKVVYPDFTFNATSTFDALRLESCTHMPAVPSLLHSLLDASSQSESSAQSLRHIEFSGAMISTHVVDEAKKHLCVSVVSTHYGMTESGPAASWPYEEMPAASDRTSVSPGLPVPGGKLKICAPGSRVPLKRGEAGEIQQSGPQVISGYLGGASKDQFYEDQHGVWMLTGDQGVMLDSGEIRVSGRYKDIIIRGGENIAPAQIEEVLNCRDNIKVSCNPLHVLCWEKEINSTTGPGRWCTRRLVGRGARCCSAGY